MTEHHAEAEPERLLPARVLVDPVALREAIKYLCLAEWDCAYSAARLGTISPVERARREKWMARIQALLDDALDTAAARPKPTRPPGQSE